MEIHTHSVETQTNFHAPLELTETKTQIDALVTVEKFVQTEEVLHSSEHDATIRRLELELEQSQQTLTQF
jgi:hypothetical protein